MSTKTDISNLALVRLGEDTLTDVDADDKTTADEINAIWTPTLEDTLNIGPEKGWRFARWRINSVDVDSTSITAVADYSSTVSGTVLVTAAAHGLLTGDLVNISDTDAYDGDFVITNYRRSDCH